LTGIKQEWVDSGQTLSDTLILYNKWLMAKGLIDYDLERKLIYTKNFAFITCGDWDLNKMLPGQCKREKIKVFDYYRRWINIKKSFQSFYKRNPEGMERMLKYLKIDLVGKHHSGIDDCRNICSILKRMILDGFVFDFTSNNLENLQKFVIPENLKVEVPENHQLVNKMKESAISYINKESLSKFLELKNINSITEKDIVKTKGLFTKFITEKLKADFPENINFNDKKEVNSFIIDRINVLIKN